MIQWLRQWILLLGQLEDRGMELRGCQSGEGSWLEYQEPFEEQLGQQLAELLASSPEQEW